MSIDTFERTSGITLTKVNKTYCTLVAALLSVACTPDGAPTGVQRRTSENPFPEESKPQLQPTTPGNRFRDISEIIAEDSRSTWVLVDNQTTSLALHFGYPNTLAVSYSPECWIMFPCEVDGNNIVILWNPSIDSKYDFEIVTAIKSINRAYLGKPFMILQLENDSTLNAIYPRPELIRILNSSSKERILFPDKFEIAREGFLI
ncbi:MAG: hypothetical protein ACK5XV_01940 [Flavobacteriales bacterium]|jgi:hypothetical protein